MSKQTKKIKFFLLSLCFLPFSLNADTVNAATVSSDQSLIDSLYAQIQTLTAEITKLIQAKIAALEAQTTTTTSSSQTSSTRSSSSNSSDSSGSSDGGNKPFGGLSTSVTHCNCSDNYMVKISPAGSSPKTLMYEPNSTIVYAYSQVTRPGTELLGTYGDDDECLIWSGDNCYVAGSGPEMVMVGTSGGADTSDSSGGGSGNNGNGGGDNNSEASSTPLTDTPDQCARMGTQSYSYAARGTGYYPSSSSIEGGFTDRLGRPLQTLQAYLAGNASYVSVAMDSTAFPYGTELCIPELEEKYGQQIVFKVVDTGGAFSGMGTSRIDICTANEAASEDGTINSSLTLVSQVQSR